VIENRDLIFFADDWGRHPSTMQHLARVFLRKNNRIIWVGSLGYRKPRIHWQDLIRVYEKTRKVFAKSKSGNSSSTPVYQVHPPILPIQSFSTIRRINELFISRALRQTMTQLGFSNPITFTASPIVSDTLVGLGLIPHFYFCLDDYSKFTGAFKVLSGLEEKLIGSSTACFAVSDLLVDRCHALNNHSFFLPQGVDVHHFRKDPDKIPDALKNMRRPVIGYFGLIADYIDIELITACAKRYRDFSFVLLGKATVDLGELKELHNVFYFGPVPYDGLPAFSSVFDVGLVPFRVNELTKAANPLKLLEYMSLGIPVVSTPLPEVKKFRELIFVSENETDFVEMVQRAVDDNAAGRNAGRRKIAEEFSWDKVAEDVSAIILRSLDDS